MDISSEFRDNIIELSTLVIEIVVLNWNHLRYHFDITLIFLEGVGWSVHLSAGIDSSHAPALRSLMGIFDFANLQLHHILPAHKITRQQDEPRKHPKPSAKKT